MPNGAPRAGKWLALGPLLLALSCDGYTFNPQATGVVTASSSWATDGTLAVEGTLEIFLSSWDSDTSFALDGLRFSFTSMPDAVLELESLELDEEDWPVFVAAGTQEMRTVRFTLQAPPADPLPQNCPSSLSIDVVIDVLADADVDSEPTTFVSSHVCEGCTIPDGVGIPVAWEAQIASPFFEVRDIEVDATPSVWLLGPKLDNTGLWVQSVTPGATGTAIEIATLGEAEIATGSQPGILLAWSSDVGFGGGGAGGSGEGGGSQEPASATVRVSRYDPQGLELWHRDLTGNSPRPTLLAFAGHVLVAVASPSGLATDGEILDASPNDYLVLLDEQTGEVVRFSAGFVATAMAPSGDDAGVVFGHPSDAVDSPELRLLDTELAPIWSEDMSANGITLFAELATAGQAIFVYDPAAGLVMKRTLDGSPVWDSSVPTGARTLAARPTGETLLGGPSIAVRVDSQGEVTDLTSSSDAEPLWCAAPTTDYGFASAGESPGFVLADPIFSSLVVGRLAP